MKGNFLIECVSDLIYTWHDVVLLIPVRREDWNRICEMENVFHSFTHTTCKLIILIILFYFNKYTY